MFERLKTEKYGGYLFILPALGFLIIFFAYPIFHFITHSFVRQAGFGPSEYVGLANFSYIFSDPIFWKSLGNNLLVAAFLPAWVFFPLLLSVLVYGTRLGGKFFRSAFFFPTVLSSVVVGTLFEMLLRENGPLNIFLQFVGLDVLIKDWLIDIRLTMFVIIAVVFWASFGTGVLIMSAGLSTVPPTLYDAAKIEGASGWQILLHVTLPVLRPIITTWSILCAIFVFTALFPYVFIMTAGGPGYTTMVLDYMIYSTAFLMGRQGLACSLGLILFLIILGIGIVQIRFITRGGE